MTRRRRSPVEQSRHDEAVGRSAAQYEARGYRVMADVPGFDRPDLIRGRRPDLIVQRGREKKVARLRRTERSRRRSVGGRRLWAPSSGSWWPNPREGSPGRVVPTAILVMPMPVRFQVGEGDSSTDGYQAIQKRIDRAAELIPLATLLGIERDDYLLPSMVWSTKVGEPVFATSGYQVAYMTGPQTRSAIHGFRSAHRSGGEALTEGEEIRLHDWAELVEHRYDPVIRIAVRRTISALLERTAAEDSLIDAVIALENLFGHGETSEVSFRVTAALTLLLEPDPAKRLALRSELKKMYDARSVVIHGSTVTGQTSLSELKERAIRTAVEALRVLFAERPHLIPDRERGIHLILDTAGPEGQSPEKQSG